MRYVIPQTITLTSTTVSTTGDYTAYNASTTYNTGDKCSVVADKKNYICTANATVGKTPSLNPTIWISEPMNAYAMLDLTSAKKTVASGNMTFKFNSINIDAIHLFGVTATSVTVSVKDLTTNTVIFNETTNMETADIDNFADYLFSEQELTDLLSARLTTIEMQNVINAMSNTQILTAMTATPPIYYNVEVTVTLVGTTTALGYIIVGRQRELGVTLYGGTTGIKSYTTKERDDWGNMNLVAGNTYDTMDLPVSIDSAKVSVVKERLKKIDSVPCVFIGDENDNFPLTIFGTYFDLEMPITPTKSQYNLRIESII